MTDTQQIKQQTHDGGTFEGQITCTHATRLVEQTAYLINCQINQTRTKNIDQSHPTTSAHSFILTIETQAIGASVSQHLGQDTISETVPVNIGLCYSARKLGTSELVIGIDAQDAAVVEAVKKQLAEEAAKGIHPSGPDTAAPSPKSQIRIPLVATRSLQFRLLVVLIFLLVLAPVMVAIAVAERGQVIAQKQLEQTKVKEKTERRGPQGAWDLASDKLEAYFDRNLSQINQVFYLGAAVMMVGFCFVLAGIGIVLYQTGNVELSSKSLIAVIPGLITQFIGATFMVLYRSTMTQATTFMSILDRINTVRMAVQVLESLPEGDRKDRVRAQMVGLLLRGKGPIRHPAENSAAGRRAKASVADDKGKTRANAEATGTK